MKKLLIGLALAGALVACQNTRHHSAEAGTGPGTCAMTGAACDMDSGACDDSGSCDMGAECDVPAKADAGCCDSAPAADADCGGCEGAEPVSCDGAAAATCSSEKN